MTHVSVEPTGDWFPLVDPSPDVRGLFADLHLEAVTTIEPTLPLRIVFLDGLRWPGTPILVIADAKDNKR